MKTTQRMLSIFLAVIIAVSVMSVGFISVNAAPPIVPRNIDVMPKATFGVADYLTTYGTNQYLPGTNVNPVVRGVFFYLDGATNVRLSTTSGVSFGAYYTSESMTYWDITGGSETANQYAKFTVTYVYNKRTYTNDAYTWIMPNSNDASIVNEMKEHKTWLGRDCETHHQFYITPTYGKFENYVPSLVTGGSGSGYFNRNTNIFNYDASSSVAAFKWHRDSSSGSSTEHSLESQYSPTGEYYIDTSLYPTLESTDLRANIYCYGGEIDENHTRSIQQIAISSQALNGAMTTGGYGTSFDGVEKKMWLGDLCSYSLTGKTPAAGSVLELTVRAQIKGRTVNLISSASMTVNEYIKVRIVTFDKSELRNLLVQEKANNRQAKYYTPASWANYSEAYRNACIVLGRPNVEQSEINSAYTALYNIVNNSLVFNSASYEAIDILLARVPLNYNNHPEYYTTASTTALSNAIADISYDRPLDMRYQQVIDTMATNLSNALKGLTYNTYNITYDTNGGTAQAKSSAVLFEKVNEPDLTSAKPGYTFAGWCTDKELTAPVQWPIAMPYPGITLYAKWEINKATISFSSDGGTCVEPYTAAIGSYYGGPSFNPTKAGYNFAGWFKDAMLNVPVSWPITIPSSGMMLYAKWEVARITLNFDSKGGSSVASITQDYNSSVAKPANPSKTGYGFVGWYYDESFTRLVSWPAKMPNENTTLYAKWSASDFTITFDSNGGSAVESIIAPVGSLIGAPAAPTRVGYTFNYWTYAGARYTFSTMPAVNLVLVASWTPLKFTITFNCGAGTPVAAITQDCGSIIAAPINPTLKGYLFDGWLLNNELYALTTMPARDLTLVAKWIVMPDLATIKLNTDIPSGKTTLEQGDVINITLNVGANYYVGSSSFPIFYDTTYFEPAFNNEPFTEALFGPQVFSSGFMSTVENLDPTSPDWNLWETGDLTGRVNSSIPQFYPYAWRENGSTLKNEYKKYGLIYAQMNSGSSSISGGKLIKPEPAQNFIKFQLRVKADAPVTAGDAKARIFIPQEAAKRTTTGWTGNRLYLLKMSGNTSGGEMGTFDQIVYNLSEADLNYSIAKRTTPLNYTISFNSDGGSPVETITRAQGSSVAEPTAPTRENYVFKGWTYNGETVIWPFVMQNINVEFKATWVRQRAKYTIYHYKQNVNATGYSLSTGDTRIEEDYVGETVTAASKNFEGFTYNQNESTSSGKLTADGVLVLHLYYTRNIYTLSFNSAGGTAVSSITQRYGALIAEPERPTQIGYTFTGWILNNSAVAWPFTMPFNGASLTASWQVNEYTLSFYIDDGSGSKPYTTIKGNYGTAISSPTVTPPEGFLFSGWNPAVPATMPASNMDFYGTLYSDGYRIYYYLNSQLYLTQTYELGAAIVAPTVTVPSGSAFSGWSPALPAVMPNTSLTVYGVLSKNKVTVTYYLDDYEYTSLTGRYGTKLSAPEVVEPEGFVFSGWSPEITTFPEDDKKISGKLTPIQYSVKFFVNDVANKTVSGAVGTPVEAPIMPTLGYTFKGWYSDSALTVSAPAPNSIPASNVNLYASYKINSYTVKFILDNADYSSQRLEYGAVIEAPKVTVPIGYSFSGWSPAVDATVPAKDVTYSGRLVANKYTLSFFLDGQYYTAITGIYGINVVAPVVNISDNYAFSGWSPAVPKTMPAENMRFDARIILDTATVAFELNNGTGTCPISVTDVIGTKVTLPAQGSIVRDGYTFLGWATTADAKQALTDFNIPSGGITLYAVWRLNVTPKIVAIDGSTTVIDDERGYIYGLAVGVDEIGLEKYIGAVGNAHIEYEYGMNVGTGTKVKLVENDTKEVLATYYIIIFGDIDGDGFVNGNDSSISSATAAWLNVLAQNSPYKFAADIDGMEGFNSSDSSYLIAVTAHIAEIDQRVGVII